MYNRVMFRFMADADVAETRYPFDFNMEIVVSSIRPNSILMNNRGDLITSERERMGCGTGETFRGLPDGEV